MCGGECLNYWDTFYRISERISQLKKENPEEWTTSGPSPVPSIFSLPEILCLILGALLFLVIIILVILLHRWRVECRALSSFEDALDEATYEEIGYYVTPKKEALLSRPAQRTDAFSEVYDDVEEVPGPKAPSASQMSEGEVPPEENGVGASRTGSPLHFPTGAAHPGKEDSPWLLQGQKEDPGYDDIELSVPGTAAVAFHGVVL
ncbi:antigen WC1.1-like [Molossus nigricans]